MAQLFIYPSKLFLSTFSFFLRKPCYQSLRIFSPVIFTAKLSYVNFAPDHFSSSALENVDCCRLNCNILILRIEDRLFQVCPSQGREKQWQFKPNSIGKFKLGRKIRVRDGVDPYRGASSSQSVRRYFISLVCKVLYSKEASAMPARTSF